MRLIDADDFKQKLLAKQFIGYGDYYSGAEAERDSIVDELNDAPTIETTHNAHWICGQDNQDTWYCSKCKTDILPADWFVTPIEEGYRYCPNCGAKMYI